MGKKVELLDVDSEKVMNEIRKAASPPEEVKHWVTIYVMGKPYRVPAGLTIMKALEYAGYRYIRGAGCRAGFCGACATIYRKKGEYRFRTALACQTTVEDGMYLAQVPFVPANKATYNIDEIEPTPTTLLEYYPEIARCVSCNTCTKACPQELDVMYYIQYGIRGDIKKVAELSFDCIQCGLCTLRCPAEIQHYHMAQFARRLYGKYYMKRSPFLKRRLKEIESGMYEKAFEQIKKWREENPDRVKELYRYIINNGREKEKKLIENPLARLGED
ncbi:2Fe-2S iron-sulfur cluster protein [Aciduliprofundum sp. MAR08-339]|uniref:4Fe-4S dicluster domain-containing protein n=1 Tax=Aciduliprofundum sp. (strain MAR08-339) TaxID=673860 RepID=UPI0002A4879C|nr:2Fe-2S iron-sulfur cluster protein [Aciduliprofundum sp. MAR08-339]